MDLPEVAVGVLGATGYIGAPYRAEMRACEGVRMVALCARRMDLLEAAAKGYRAPTNIIRCLFAIIRRLRVEASRDRAPIY